MAFVAVVHSCTFLTASDKYTDVRAELQCLVLTYSYFHSNIQIYILQYNQGGIQEKVKRLIRICFPLKKMMHS